MEGLKESANVKIEAAIIVESINGLYGKTMVIIAALRNKNFSQ